MEFSRVPEWFESVRLGIVLEASNIESQLSSKRKGGGKVVFTNGCFDLLHVGHVRYLKEAKSLGDYLFVGLNSDSSVKRLKGENRPILDQQSRAEILASLSCVDFVCLFDEETPRNLIELVKPDILVKGGDWKKEEIVGWEFVEKYGGAVQSLQFVPGNSTTGIVEKIIESFSTSKT